MSTVTKGKGFEREIRRALLDAGFPARRTPRSGATDFAKGDVQFDSMCLGAEAEYAAQNPKAWKDCESDGELYTIECKRRKSIPTWLTECLEHDVACLREDRGETVVVMKLGTWLELMK